jgi:hypothetical protein
MPSTALHRLRGINMSLAATLPSNPVHPSMPRMLGIKEASALYSVDPRTFRRWADAGKVPAGVRLAGRMLWRSDHIENHIRSLGN